MDKTGIILLFVLLAAVWGAFLFPEIFASRRNTPLNSTEEFDRWTARLASVQVRGRMGLGGRAAVLARRRRMLVFLGTLAAGSLMLAFALGSPSWLLVHIAIDAAVAWYVAMLVQIKQRRAARPELEPVGPLAPPDATQTDEQLIKIVAS